MRAAEKVQLFGDEPLTIERDLSDTIVAISGYYASDTVVLGGVEFDLLVNHLRFLNTDYGLAMQGVTRYSGFVQRTSAALDRDMPTANEQFRGWIGPDVNLALHEPHTTRIARFILEREKGFQFDAHEQAALIFSVMHHDKGESVVGDIEYFLKTEDDEQQEASVLEIVLREVYPEYSDEIIELVQSSTGKSGTNKLATVFNAIERMGYYDTALRAWRIHRQLEDRQDRLALFGLACEVAQHHAITLERYAKDMTSVAEYLAATRPMFDEIVAANP